MYKVIIVDFNGTLVQSKYLVIQLMNDLADKYGYEKIADEDIEQLASMTIRERMKLMKCPFYKLPLLVADLKKRYKEDVVSLDMVPGVRDVLAQAKNNGMTMGILSSNSVENIQRFLGDGDQEIFDFICTARSLFGKDKALKKLLKERGYAPEEVLYLGDELRDAEACSKAGIDCALVTWGYDAEELLQRGKPEHMVRRPEELVEILALA